MLLVAKNLTAKGLAKRDRLTAIRKAIAPQRAELLRAMRSATPAYRRAFLDAIRNTAGDVVLARVSEAIERGDWTAAEAAIPWEKLEYELGALTPLFRQGYEKGAAIALAYMPERIQTVLRFDLLNPRSVDFIRRHTAELLVNVTDSSRLGVRSIIEQSFQQGMHPYQSAKLIRNTIGLTDRQARAVMNYRAGQIKQGANIGRADEAAKIYADKLLDYRAEIVSRTEIATSSARGQRALWEDAVEQGYLDPATTHRIWLTAGDSRVCDWCAELEGKEIGFYDEYHASVTNDNTGLTREKTSLTPPLHPACRCSEALTFY